MASPIVRDKSYLMLVKLQQSRAVWKQTPGGEVLEPSSQKKFISVRR